MADKEAMLATLARLAEVDLIDLHGAWPTTTTTTTTTTTSTSRGDAASRASKPVDSALGKVFISSEIPSVVDSSSDIDSTIEHSDKPSHAQPLVPSDVPSSLDVTFSPDLQPPTYGLIIRKLGGGPGAGFVNVTFVNCTFHHTEPTIFENCWLSNVTFRDCDFRASQFENVAISTAEFTSCTFQCLWMNQKLPENLIANKKDFTGEYMNDLVPKGVVALNKERNDARKAKLLDPPAPTKAHYSGIGVIKGFSTKEDEYLRYAAVDKPEHSREASSIPLSVTGLTFDNSPQAGLFVKLGKGYRYEDVHFVGCSFKNTTFDNCYLDSVVFKDCKFESASFKEVVFIGRTYSNVYFDGCAWKRRVRSTPITIANTTYRNGGDDGPHIPQYILDQAVVQEREEMKQEQMRQAVIKAQRPPVGIEGAGTKPAEAPLQAVSRAPSGAYALKNLRRNQAVKTADEIVRERLRPGERVVIETTPGAKMVNPNEKVVATKFVQLPLSGW